MDDATQALLVGVPGIDRDDPAIQAALAVMCLEEPQAPSATLSELREAVTKVEDLARDARRVLGSAHPFVVGPIEQSLRRSRAALRARETPSEAV